MKRARSAAGVVLAVCLLVAGCTSAPASIDGATARSLQRSVNAVGVLAEAHRYPAALAEVDRIQSGLRAAIASGRITGDRAVVVQAALDQVRSDLTTVERPASSAVPSSTASGSTRPSTVSKHSKRDSPSSRSGGDGDGGGD